MFFFKKNWIFSFNYFFLIQDCVIHSILVVYFENPLIFTIGPKFLSTRGSLVLRCRYFRHLIYWFFIETIKCQMSKICKKPNYVFRNIIFQKSTLCNVLVLPHRPLKISHYLTFVIAKLLANPWNTFDLVFVSNLSSLSYRHSPRNALRLNEYNQVRRVIRYAGRRLGAPRFPRRARSGGHGRGPRGPTTHWHPLRRASTWGPP